MFKASMLLVSLHLQYSKLQCCLSSSTCNIRSSNVACQPPLAMFDASMLLVELHLQCSKLQCCLSTSTSNVQYPNVACQPPLAMFQYHYYFPLLIVKYFFGFLFVLLKYFSHTLLIVCLFSTPHHSCASDKVNASPLHKLSSNKLNK